MLLQWQLEAIIRGLCAGREMIGIGKLAAGFVLAPAAWGHQWPRHHGRCVETDQGVVQRVVDGDTVDVSVGGTTTRIRLLNVDTPETVDPNEPVQCLGPEATEFLKSVLPAGTAVRLEYNEERTDRYDRTLAAVFTPDGKLVNAEIARQGLGAPLVVERTTGSTRRSSRPATRR